MGAVTVDFTARSRRSNADARRESSHLKSTGLCATAYDPIVASTRSSAGVHVHKAPRLGRGPRRTQGRALGVDIGLGTLAAAAAVALAPGLAIVGVAALLVLVICLVSLAAGRLPSRRR